MSHGATRTAPIDATELPPSAAPTPGLLLVHAGRPIAVPVLPGGRLGRDALASMGLADDRMSREHLALESGPPLTLVDLGSRNGTYLNGARVEQRAHLAPGDVVRAGASLLLVVEDAGVFERSPTRADGDVVVGPRTAGLLARAEALGELGQLLVTGESGAGKELVARAFHRGRGARAPFVALNCATIQPSIAERLLFGARRGAFTGAAEDADGHVQAAHGGTLFLDEVGELDLGVQAKLLRFLETREFFPVGEVRPRTADVRVCFATLRDLRGEVAQRRFREDLYHRVATPRLVVPPLRERREEIPFLVELVARRFAGRVEVGFGFVERALQAPWPGNVRQLLRTVEAALVTAEAEGRPAVGAGDLSDEALAPEAGEEAKGGGAIDELGAEPTDDEVRHALAVSGGNVSVAARALGVHRSKLRRRIAKLGLPSA